MLCPTKNLTWESQKSVLMGVIGFIILVLADQWTKKNGGAASEGSGSDRTDKKCI